MFRKERFETLPPLIISFGDVVLTYDHDRRVIVDVSEKDSCEAARIIGNPPNEEIGIAGSIFRHTIVRKTGEQWDLDRILQAAMRHFGDSEATGGVYDTIRRNSNQVSRELG